MTDYMSALCRALVAILSIALTGCAMEDRIPQIQDDLDCRFTHKVQEFSSLREMPKAITDDLFSHISDRDLQGFGIPEPPTNIAERGEAFKGSDAATPGLPSRRFIRAGHVSDQWFIWYEHGGIAYNKPIVLWEMGTAAQKPRLITKVLAWENLCAQTDDLIAGKLPPPTDLDHDLNW